MSTSEIFHTKKEAGLDEFEYLRHQQKKKSDRAALTASLSRRSPDAPEDTTRRLVRVVAQERRGLDGFHRAGQYWPSAPEGRVVVVRSRMLAALKSEPMLRVEVDPEGTGIDPASVEDNAVLDVPLRETVDLSQVLGSATREEDSSGAFERGLAQGRLEKKDEEIARLQAELKAAKAEAAKAEAKKAEPKATEPKA